MALVAHAAAPYPQTDSKQDPVLLSARRLAGKRDPRRPQGPHHSDVHLTAFTDGEVYTAQCCPADLSSDRA